MHLEITPHTLSQCIIANHEMNEEVQQLLRTHLAAVNKM